MSTESSEVGDFPESEAGVLSEVFPSRPQPSGVLALSDQGVNGMRGTPSLLMGAMCQF